MRGFWGGRWKELLRRELIDVRGDGMPGPELMARGGAFASRRGSVGKNGLTGGSSGVCGWIPRESKYPLPPVSPLMLPGRDSGSEGKLVKLGVRAGGWNTEANSTWGWVNSVQLVRL